MSIPGRICQQCGTPLAPGEVFCSNCGTRYIEQGVIDPTQRATPYPGTPTPPPAYPPTQYAGPGPSSSPYGNNPYGSTNYGSATPGFAPPPPANPTPPYGGTPPYGMSSGPYSQPTIPAGASVPGAYGQPSVPPMQPMQPGQVGSYQPAPQPKKKGPNVLLIVGIVLVVVLASCGVGTYFVVKAISNTASTTNSTPTATATSQPTTAPTSQPTTAPTPQALFSDNFADNSKSWSLSSGSGYSITIQGHQMVLSEANHKVLSDAIPTSNTYTDFIVTATFTITQGDMNDSVGVFVRGNSKLTNGYFIEIYGDNSYDIYKAYPDLNQEKAIVGPSNSDVIKPQGQANTIKATVKGSQIIYEINGTVVATVTDTDYTSGDIAVFASNGSSSNGVKGTFDSIAVYPIS